MSPSCTANQGSLGSFQVLCADVFGEILEYLPPKEALTLATLTHTVANVAYKELEYIAKNEQHRMGIVFTAIHLTRDGLSRHFQSFTTSTLRDIGKNLSEHPLRFYAYLAPVQILLRADVLTALEIPNENRRNSQLWYIIEREVKGISEKERLDGKITETDRTNIAKAFAITSTMSGILKSRMQYEVLLLELNSDKALAVANTITDENIKDKALRDISYRIAARDRRIDKAIGVAGSISEEWMKIGALDDINRVKGYILREDVFAAARESDFTKAFAIAQTIQDWNTRNVALQGIEQISGGRFTHYR
ncbi:MAG: hypothetical protein HW387_533 [Parachlamydiales bacterium]|nr:hypothetical protein [Parachlamydiales bacterium]